MMREDASARLVGSHARPRRWRCTHARGLLERFALASIVVSIVLSLADCPEAVSAVGLGTLLALRLRNFHTRKWLCSALTANAYTALWYVIYLILHGVVTAAVPRMRQAPHHPGGLDYMAVWVTFTWVLAVVLPSLLVAPSRNLTDVWAEVTDTPVAPLNESVKAFLAALGPPPPTTSSMLAFVEPDLVVYTTRNAEDPSRPNPNFDAEDAAWQAAAPRSWRPGYPRPAAHASSHLLRGCPRLPAAVLQCRQEGYGLHVGHRHYVDSGGAGGASAGPAEVQDVHVGGAG